MNTAIEISPAEIVRKPVGTTQTYTMYKDELPYFLKKLSTYALRANAKIQHRIATIVWDDNDKVTRMVVVKVLKAGKKLQRRGRKVSTE